MIKRIYSLIYCNEAAFRKYCYNMDLYKKGELDSKPSISKLELNINGEERDKFTLSEIDSLTASFKDEKSLIKEIIPKSRVDKTKSFYIIYQSRGVRNKELIYNSNFMLHISSNVAARKRSGESNVLVDMSEEVSKYLKIVESSLFNGKGHSGFFNDKINDYIFNIKTAMSNSFDRSDSTLESEQNKRYYINKFKLDIRQYSNFRDSFLYSRFKDINIDEILYKKETEEVIFEEEDASFDSQFIKDYADAKGLTEKEVLNRMAFQKNKNTEGQINLFDNSNNKQSKTDEQADIFEHNNNTSKFDENNIDGKQITLEEYFGGHVMSKNK